MENKPRIHFIFILLLIGGYICFPFFRIKYIEISSVFNLLYPAPVIIILLISLIITCRYYFKYLKKLNKPTDSLVKKRIQDIITISILTIAFFGIIFGMSFSTILTTNVFIGQSTEVNITAPVINYSAGKTRFGRTTHRINFISPHDNKEKSLGVKREYMVGEIFDKKMMVGSWGLLYSLE